MRLFPVPDSEQASVGGLVSSSAVGAISEHLAIAKLLESGHRVAIPVVDDDGVDMVVNYGVTVQIKAKSRPVANSVYAFSLDRSRYRADGSRRPNDRKLTTAEVLICHGVEHGAWWVIPVEWLRATGWDAQHSGFSLSLDPRHKSKYADLSRTCRDRWDVFSDGSLRASPSRAS